jgi:hypothetical protein
MKHQDPTQALVRELERADASAPAAEHIGGRGVTSQIPASEIQAWAEEMSRTFREVLQEAAELNKRA